MIGGIPAVPDLRRPEYAVPRVWLVSLRSLNLSKGRTMSKGRRIEDWSLSVRNVPSLNFRDDSVR